jgi:hypothetical protein
MDPVGFARAKAFCSRARQSLDEMNNAIGARNLDRAVERWGDFLSQVQRILNMLDAATRSHPASRGWYGKLHSWRCKDGEVLQYVWKARDADEHGIAIEEVSRQGAISPDIGAWQSQTVVLVPLVNWGVTYPPPIRHLGKPIDKPGSAGQVGELAITFLEKKLAEADRKFLQPLGKKAG